MTFDREALERLREAIATEPWAEEGDGPDPERVWAAAAGELSDEETLQVVDRVVASPEWARAWRFAVDMGARGWGEADAGEVADVLRARSGAVVDLASRRRARAWLAAGLVGTLALAAAGLLTVLPTAPQGTGEYRVATGEAIGSELDGGAVDRDGATLRWTPLDGARYAVTVSSESGEVLYEAHHLGHAEVTVPEDALAGVPSGGAVLWQVHAALIDGRALVSPTFRTTVP